MELERSTASQVLVPERGGLTGPAIGMSLSSSQRRSDSCARVKTEGEPSGDMVAVLESPRPSEQAEPDVGMFMPVAVVGSTVHDGEVAAGVAAQTHACSSRMQQLQISQAIHWWGQPFCLWLAL